MPFPQTTGVALRPHKKTKQKKKRGDKKKRANISIGDKLELINMESDILFCGFGHKKSASIQQTTVRTTKMNDEKEFSGTTK